MNSLCVHKPKTTPSTLGRSSTHFPTINWTKPKKDFTPNSTRLRRSCTDLQDKTNTSYQSPKVSFNLPCVSGTVGPNGSCPHVFTTGALRLPPINQPNRNSLDVSHTQNDWESDNYASYSTSNYLRSRAERLRNESVRLCQDQSMRAQTSVGKKINNRVNAIVFCKNELNRETELMLAENAALKETMRMLLKALPESEDCLSITQECLYNRQSRHGIDLVHDVVEMALLDEVSETRKCQEKMRKILKELNPQINLNLTSLYELEADEGGKYTTQCIDEYANNLYNYSSGLDHHDGVELINNTKSDPETWFKFTNENIKRSQTRRVASRKLRSEVDSVLHECSNIMCYHWNLTNEALTVRIKETIDAKIKTQAHLYKTMQEIFDLNKNIELIKKSIEDRHIPLKVAQTRLDVRLRRADIEACQDPAQYRLVSEIGEIQATLESLQKKLISVEDAMQELLTLKSSLENNLGIKINTLFIDREKCLAYRKTFPMAPICWVSPGLMLNKQRPYD